VHSARIPIANFDTADLTKGGGFEGMRAWVVAAVVATVLWVAPTIGTAHVACTMLFYPALTISL